MKLEKFNYNSSKKGKWFLYGVICTVLLMVLLNLFLSHAKYLNLESIKLAEGTINYKPYDFKIMAMYQKNTNGVYEEIDTMPTSNYIINEEKSYCTLDNINKDSKAILKTNDNWEHIISNLSKGEKCYLYFDEKIIPMVSIAYSSGYNPNIACKNTYSTDNGTSWQSLVASSSTITLPIGTIIKGSDTPYYCDMYFCSTAACSSSSYYKIGTIYHGGQYQLTGNEVSYSYNMYYCFTKDTIIWAYDEKKKKKKKKKIKDFKVGEYVYTYNEKLKKYTYAKIKRIEITKTHEVYTIKLKNNEIIHCSGGHSFYTYKTGLMMAKELKVGYSLIGIDNTNYEILDIHKDYYEDEIELYNLCLEDGNNCFITSLKIMAYAVTALSTFNLITKKDIAYASA